jgi:hypothetical protein
MSRSLRLVGAAAAACASVPFLGLAPAHADTASKLPSNSAYFNATGVDKPDPSPAAPPNLTSDHADGVAAGHLAVAAKGGTEDKVSFLYYDLFDIPAGSVIDKAVVQLLTVPLSPDDISFQAAPEKVQACQAGDQGFSGDDGTGLAKNAPSRLCDKFKTVGKASADGKAYEFDITALANSWLTDANEGVAFTAAATATDSNFQVVFDKAATATLLVTYTLPVDTTPPVTPPDITPGIVVTPPDLGTGFTPTPGSGYTPGVPDVSTPAVPNPTVNQPPVAAPQQPATRSVAAVSASMRPTNGFWLAGFALLVGLALLSLVFGDTRVPAVQRSRSRLTQALSSRQGVAGARAGFRTLPI